MSAACPLCDGSCSGIELAPLLVRDLMWLWQQLADIADRRGDPVLAEGTASVSVPEAVEARAAAAGLLEGRLRPNRSRRVDLAALSASLRRRGAVLTPGAVAAHAVGRRLAMRSLAEAERERRVTALHEVFRGGWPTGLPADVEPIWVALRRGGWIARCLSAADPHALILNALAVLGFLESSRGGRIDRRRLAADLLASAHALDDGTPVAGLVLAMLAAIGWVPPRTRPRAAWALVGVDCDDVTGGLLAIGISPRGWTIPTDAVVTIPPRILRSCDWQPAPAGAWIFVTENPSIAAAAADLAATGVPVRLLCTSGTPSAVEVAAIGRLANAEWRIAVRADFDPAGLRHVAALLAGVPGAVPWRMGEADYEESIAGRPELADPIDPSDALSTPWSPLLAVAMTSRGVVAHEEALASVLLDDLRAGRPRANS